MALSDSPIGMAAYVSKKKFQLVLKLVENSSKMMENSSSSKKSSIREKFNMDELLNNVMMYFTTNSITTSMRMWSESFSSKQSGYN